MTSGFSVDSGVLLAGVLLFVGVVGSSIASRLRIPSLLLFLGLGMIVADDGLALVQFDDAGLAQNIAAVALLVILFEGGLGTDPAAFRSAGGPAVLLATLGVVITAGVVALAAWYLIGLDGTTALLLGSVVASTDAAAVFATLRNESLPLRTQRILQLESGLNDPVAVLLTIGMVEVWRGNPSLLDWSGFLAAQLLGGAAVGLGVGWIGELLVDKVRVTDASSLGVMTLAIAAMSFGLAAAIGGSGFLAVYLTGVVIARAQRAARSVLFFHEGLASTAQGVLFLLLGILVFPREAFDDLGLAMVIATVLVFVARPLAVFAVLSWSRTPVRRMLVISWAGLRGAVPIVLATIPFTAGHPDGALIFDVTFVVVVLSVLVQAPTMGPLARRLEVVADETVAIRPEIVPVDASGVDLVEVSIPEQSGLAGLTVSSAALPDEARIAIVRRAETVLIASGSTVLDSGDVLLIIVPRESTLDALEKWSHGTDHPDSRG